MQLPFTNLKDNKLIQAFHRGEEWAFSKIHARYARAILHFISQQVRDPAIAEDLCQEIFLKVFRFRTSYQIQYAFSTWLWTIARNTLSDWFRKIRNTEAPAPTPSHDMDGPSLAEQVPSTDPDAETLLQQKNDKHALETLLAQLTEMQRQVLSLRLISRLSYQEIAEQLGLSLSAVKCLVYRARRVLRDAGAAPAFT